MQSEVNPPSLLKICSSKLAKLLPELSSMYAIPEHEKLFLHSRISDDVFAELIKNNYLSATTIHECLKFFKTDLTTLAPSQNDFFHDEFIATFADNPIEYLDVRNCPITVDTFRLIERKFRKLKTLLLGGSVLVSYFHPNKSLFHYINGTAFAHIPILNKPSITSLHLEKFNMSSNLTISHPGLEMTLARFLRSFPFLHTLNLSKCKNIDEWEFLTSLKYLRSLTLYGVNNAQIASSFDHLFKIKSLEHLDISSNVGLALYTEPSLTLARIVHAFPALKSLDISSTNLCGLDVLNIDADRKYISKALGIEITDDYVVSSIPGLLALEKPLEFLGILECSENPAFRRNLPALKVAGEGSESQILTGFEVYKNRSEACCFLLNRMSALFRENAVIDFVRCGDAVMDCVEHYSKNGCCNSIDMQIASCTCCFFISEFKARILPYRFKRRIVDMTISAMQNYCKENVIMRTCCHTLCCFIVPDDVLFAFERVIQLVWKMLNLLLHEHFTFDRFVMESILFLLNSFSSSIHGEEKTVFNRWGTVSLVTKAIERLVLLYNDFDELVEVAWNFLWNVTDESKENCEEFLIRSKGMNVFYFCLKRFNLRTELVRNMMGLLGNVAECQNLRFFLMSDQYISTFRLLLFDTSGGIEIPYNAGGVLAHLLSDGEDAWTCSANERSAVIRQLYYSILSWDLCSHRSINYRSFQPILSLAAVFHTPVCQLWACWALANLTTMFPAKYCVLLQNEKGVEVLNAIVGQHFVDKNVSKFASITLQNVEDFTEFDTVF